MRTLRSIPSIGTTLIAMTNLLGSLALAGEAPKTLPTFSLPDLEGKAVTQANFAGKPVVLDFWATWCETCKETVPKLVELSHKYQGQGLVVVGISVDKGSDSKIQKAAKKLGIDYLVLRDKEDTMGKVFGFNGIPSLYVYDGKGALKLGLPGYNPDQEKQLEGAVTSALASIPPKK